MIACTGGSSKRPMRMSASLTWRCFSSSWRSYGSTCHEAPGCGARGSMRSGDGVRISVVRHGALDEHDVAVEPRHAVAAVRERVDRQLELLALVRAGAWRLRLHPD